MRREETPSPPLLEVRELTVACQGKTVVRDICFSLKKGEILGIVGESGSGKSTILKAVMGILGEEYTITKGEILYKGNNLLELSRREKRKISGPEIGMIFQDTKDSLCPVRRVESQIYEALAEHETVTKKEARNRAELLLKKLGFAEGERVLKSYPFELSGGMSQRVGICMAMLLSPALLLADEPTSALDVTVQKQVVEKLLELRKEEGTAMAVVTHNIGVVRAMADQVLVLKEGCMVEYGRLEEVLEHPKEAYTRQLLSSALTLRRAKEEGEGR